MITYKKGNLLDDNAKVLVNTVNTIGVMGKGIALALKNAFPHNFAVYKTACKNGDLAIGRLLIVKDSNLLSGERTIINFPTKVHWRDPSRYEYIETGLIALADHLKNNHVERIAIPALGCGNGGLDWRKVKVLIEKHLLVFNFPIVIYR